jgi:ABC-2 type transport system permease protein
MIVGLFYQLAHLARSLMMDGEIDRRKGVKGLHRAYATFVRNWIITRRAYHWSFFFSVLLGGLMTVAIAYLTYHVLAAGHLGASFTGYTGISNYMSYIILGAGVYLVSVRVMLGVSRGLITERREGTFESLLLTPGHRMEYFGGITVQWIIVSCVEMLVMFLITWPLGLRFEHIDFMMFLLILPVALLGLFGMSTVLSGIMLATGDTYIVQNTLFIAMALLCGFSFPPNYLPVPLQWVGAFIPVTGSLHLLRAVLLQGGPSEGLFGELAFYALLGLLYAVFGLKLTRWAERRVLEGAF